MKNNKGFTLVELLMAMGLTVVLIGMVSTIAFSAMGTVSDTTALNERAQLTDEVYGLIEKCLVDAADINYENGDNYITIDTDGHIAFDGSEIYDETLYRGCHLEVSLSGGRTVTLTVKLTDDAGRAYTRSGSFRLLNTVLAENGSFAYGSDIPLTVYFTAPQESDFLVPQEITDSGEPEDPYPGNNGNGNANGNTGNHNGNGGNNGNDNGNGNENGNGNNGGNQHVGPGSGNGNNNNDKNNNGNNKKFFDKLLDTLS